MESGQPIQRRPSLQFPFLGFGFGVWVQWSNSGSGVTLSSKRGINTHPIDHLVKFRLC